MEWAAWFGFGLAVLNSIALLVLFREIALLRLMGATKSGLRYNTLLPEFSALSLAGTTLTSDRIRDRLLLFVSPECGRCETLLDDLRQLPESSRPPLALAVSSRGISEMDQLRHEYEFLDPNWVFVDERRRLLGELEVPGTPYAYVVGPNLRIRGSGIPSDVSSLLHLASALSG